MQLAATFFRVIMKIWMLIWPDFPREVSAVVTGMDTLNRLSNKRLELAKCVKKAVDKKIL